ncbi:site-specific recombinase, phage integrase family [Klebsiella pneumoniae]|nr:site-specific recombinase, phage integrase family [Klebsiella pneumoniae]
MATSTGATPAYLLAPEVSALLWYMPDQRHHMLFATMWNTGSRIGEARTLTPESFDLDGLRPFVRVLSEKVRARRRREPLWPVTDETMRNWLKQAVKRAEADGVHFSIAVTPHNFRHSYIMHMLYHR